MPEWSIYPCDLDHKMLKIWCHSMWIWQPACSMLIGYLACHLHEWSHVTQKLFFVTGVIPICVRRIRGQRGIRCWGITGNAHIPIPPETSPNCCLRVVCLPFLVYLNGGWYSQTVGKIEVMGCITSLFRFACFCLAQFQNLKLNTGVF